MNKVILMGRLTREPDIRWTQGQDQKCVARYTLAVDRNVKRTEDSNQVTADFISCVAFGKMAEFAEKWFTKGMKICVSGRIQTGKYQNRDGQTVYTTDVLIDSQEFCESKGTEASAPVARNTDADGFMSIPDGLEEELPWA